MKYKYMFAVILGLVPSLGMCYDAQIESLIAQKREKVALLEKCQGSTKGLKIAGISTLGLTAVGIGINIAEANKIKANDNAITAKKIKKSKTSAVKPMVTLDSIYSDDDEVYYGWRPLDDDGYTMKDDFDADYIEGTVEKLGLVPGEWAVKSAFGDVRGISKCSDKTGDNDEGHFNMANRNKWTATDNELSGSGNNCWCKITKLVTKDRGVIEEDFKWIFDKNQWNQYESCAGDCAYYCVDDYFFFDDVRSAMGLRN